MTDQKANNDQQLPVVFSEINFLIYPYFSLARKGLSETTSIEFKQTAQRGDEKVCISWKVSPSHEFGFPGPFDKEVSRAMEAIITRRGFPVSNPIPFSLYHVCKVIGISPNSGKNKEAVKEALTRITATTVLSKQTFYSKSEKRWVEDVFHLYDHVTFKGKYRPDTHEIADTNYLFLSKWYLDNLNAFYVKVLDYDFYRSLKSPVDKRYYEIMSVKFYGAFQSNVSFLRFRYSTICELFPLTRHEHLSRARQQLNPAHKRLIKQGFFRKVTWRETGEKNDWLLYFYPGPKARELLKPQKLSEPAVIESFVDFDINEGQMQFSFESGESRDGQNSRDKYYRYYSNNNNRARLSGEDPSAQPDHPDDADVVVALSGKLKNLGLPESLVAKFITEHSADYLEEKIQIVELKKSRDKRIKNSGGMLRKAIEENWQPPDELTAIVEKREWEAAAERRRQAEAEQLDREQILAEAVRAWKGRASGSLLDGIQARARREIETELPDADERFISMPIKIKVNEIIAREYLDLDESELIREQAAE